LPLATSIIQLYIFWQWGHDNNIVKLFFSVFEIWAKLDRPINNNSDGTLLHSFDATYWWQFNITSCIIKGASINHQPLMGIYVSDRVDTIVWKKVKCVGMCYSIPTYIWYIFTIVNLPTQAAEHRYYRISYYLILYLYKILQS